MAKFTKLDVPHQWKDEFTKYPHGYTIFEALCNWTKQVDEMVVNQNNWNDYLDNFVKTFEFELQEEVINTLSDWQNSGFLDVVIDTALQTQMDVLEDETNATLVGFESQLAENEEKIFYKSMVNHKKSKGMITWIDDDANRGVYTRLRPLALEYGITFTSSVITDRPHGFPGDSRPWNNAYIHYNEMVQMHNEGTAEFVSHSHSHRNLTTLTPEEIHDDMKKSQDTLKKLGFNHRVFVYPFGGENATVRNIARQYFDCAIDVYNEGGPVGSYVKKPMNQININRMNV